jgi:hypothetical protein
MKKSLRLDSVVLLGRTLEEYRQFFGLELEQLRGKRVLDVASGVSSFSAEANALGIHTTACDPIYALEADVIEGRCIHDLDLVTARIAGTTTYKWDFYGDPLRLRGFRERAYTGFLRDYRQKPPGRYIPGAFPSLPFETDSHDVALVSYLLFAYQEQFDYDFHKRSILELMRVTREEARLYPVVTFEAVQSTYIPQLAADPDLSHLLFDEVPTRFEFLISSNRYLRVRRRASEISLS